MSGKNMSLRYCKVCTIIIGMFLDGFGFCGQCLCSYQQAKLLMHAKTAPLKQAQKQKRLDLAHFHGLTHICLMIQLEAVLPWVPGCWSNGCNQHSSLFLQQQLPEDDTANSFSHRTEAKINLRRT